MPQQQELYPLLDHAAARLVKIDKKLEQTWNKQDIEEEATLWGKLGWQPNLIPWNAHGMHQGRY